MMEKVELRDQLDRAARTIPDWCTVGKTENRKQNIITSLFIQSEEMEQVNIRLQAKYREAEKNEIRVQTMNVEDADVVLVAYGLSARIARKVEEIGRAHGIKVGLIRPITLWPYPYQAIADAAQHAKAFLVLELNAGQMVEDVRLGVNGRCPVEHYGRMGGIIPSPEEVFDVLEKIYSSVKN
jgi:2-oxoglutarate ferredoxin oxidoreductase subunit alpha